MVTTASVKDSIFAFSLKGGKAVVNLQVWRCNNNQQWKKPDCQEIESVQHPSCVHSLKTTKDRNTDECEDLLFNSLKLCKKKRDITT